MAHDFTLAVNAIAIKDDKILLVKRKDRDMWRLPGGEVSLGETIDEAVMRHIKEKLGLDIRIVNVIGLYSKPIQNELVVLFEVELIDPRQPFKIGGDYQTADFFPVHKLPEKLPDKNYERIQDYLHHYPNVVIRTQMSAPSSLKFPLIKENAKQ